MPREQWNVPGRWPVSSALIHNTTDMQIVPRAGISSAPSGAISHSVAGGQRSQRASAVDAGEARKRRSGAGEVAPLGSNAKLRAVGHDPMESRLQRFALQSVARGILPKSRTAKCLRIRAHDSDVQVWKSKQYGTASYAGLQTCSSVWVCPVCSAKIAERRRVELIDAMELHKTMGGTVSLLTLTTPHQRGDVLVDLLAQQGKALQSFLRDFTVKAVFAEMGYIGQVRALEVTHGRKSATNNGWHPHFHILQFHTVKGSEADRKDWTARLYLRWAAYCQKAGLGTPSYAHGIKLDDGMKAAQYVTKGMWGLEDEMTKGHTKKAKSGGESPFDFLRAVMADKTDRQAAALFQEFAEAFKGKRQLSWSKGLKARFFVDEKTDEELSEEKDDLALLLGLLSVSQWRDVLKVKGRGVLLNIAAKGGWLNVQLYLHAIEGAAEYPDTYAALMEDPMALPEIYRYLLDPPQDL